MFVTPYLSTNTRPSLFKAFPLLSRVDHEVGRLTQRLAHETSIRKLFINYNVNPTRFATTPNTNQLPPVARRLQPYVATGGKEEALEEERRCTSMVKIYTDGSMVRGHIGAAAVLYHEGREISEAKKYVGNNREHEVYEAEVIGLLLGLELLAREQGVTAATFFIDNQAVLSTLQAGTTNNIGYFFEQLDEVIRLVRDRNRGVKLEAHWIPGHTGVKGNERVDKSAKQAADREQLTDETLPLSLRGEIPINPTAAKRTRRAGMAEEWKIWTREEGDSKRTERFTREMDPDYPSMQFKKDADQLTRHQLAIITQLRTGHYPTRGYLHCFTFADSPRCLHCDTRSKTITHLLMGCRALDDLRRERDRMMGATSRSLKAILKPGEHTKHLLNYIHRTKGRL